MDDALTGIVAGECAVPLDALLEQPTLEERFRIAFMEARTSCVSMPADAQFRGAVEAVNEKAAPCERKWIRLELDNIERVARQMRTGEGDAIPVLLHPIGLLEIWKKSKP